MRNLFGEAELPSLIGHCNCEYHRKLLEATCIRHSVCVCVFVCLFILTNNQCIERHHNTQEHELLLQRT